jgi:Fe2+ transport system protein FeoA
MRHGWSGHGRHQRGRPRWQDAESGPDGFTLGDVPGGSTATVLGYTGGEQLRRKAMDLGLVPGATVAVLFGGSGQPLVVRVGEARVMIGQGVARQVRVTQA